MKKKFIYLAIISLFLSNLACNIGITFNPDFAATESALKSTQDSLEKELSTPTEAPQQTEILTTEASIEGNENQPTPTITPEWLVPQTSIYLTQIEMPIKENQIPGAIVEFKVHYGNWSNVSIPPFDLKCLLVETDEEIIIENISLEPTKNGVTSCSLKLPDHSGSYTIQAFLDFSNKIENRDEGELTMTNSGYIE